MEKKLRLPVRAGVVVQLSQELHARRLQEWQHSLVGKFIDELAPGPLATDDALTRLWQPADAIRTIPFSGGRYVFKLDSPDDKQRIIAGSPYSVEGKLLVLQPLPPCTSVDLVRFSRVPVWITLTGLPVDLHFPEVALAVAESAGHPTETDVVLGSVSGACRVRVRVEIEAEEPLLPGSYLDDGTGTLLWVGFEYEGIPRICRNCMCIGHLEGDCKKTTIQAKYLSTKRLEVIANRMNAEVVNDPATEAVFGSPRSRSVPPVKVYGRAGPIVPVGEAATEGRGFERAGRRVTAEKTEEDVELLVLSGPAADLGGLDPFGPSQFDDASTVGPDEAQRGGLLKRKQRAGKTKK
ncbi:hypothetical protein CRG98_007396 [Punica granatum]|uniref:DUF4283 domain-containing protein n=1 Tax=Punica granatum TaxID=22663 RepID=A0A2I0KUP7_PUNGR|nr:hypothetical protein CRG98_007396 [Punica granatum]